MNMGVDHLIWNCGRLNWSRACYIVAILYVWGFNSHAQLSNLHCSHYPVDQEILLEPDFIVPKSIFVDPAVDFEYNESTSILTIDRSAGSLDTIMVCYRTLPKSFTDPYYLYSSEVYDSTALFKSTSKSEFVSYQDREELLSTPEIYKSGSITRGISFGNAQSVNVNSSLNFQMEGKLTEDLNIRAVITDQNIPFQPEGNTQQLREFDNVYIEVYNDTISLKAGDIVLNNSSSNFQRYYKNVQGGQLNLKYHLGPNISAQSSVTASSAKGQFADITIEALEGVQGPYKLRGPNGERFVVVLANSEQVYLDGRLLKRGFNFDYTIDYNLGEVTFNPGILITRFSRIRITYEYSDRNYNRSIFNTVHQFKSANTTININFYREKDDRNNPLAFALSEQDKVALQDAGEERLPVPINSSQNAAFNQSLLLYEKKDTLDLDGTPQEVFVFSRDSSKVLFQVTYSDVGVGNGDYVLLDNTVNGRVFEWRSPLNGIQQGQYEPVIFVVAPNQRQMTTIALETRMSDYSAIFGEVALSNHDLNLFSSINDEDNNGLAYKLGYRLKNRPLGRSGSYNWSLTMDYERDSKNFRPIDRFRYIEFDRDWSYNPNSDSISRTDNIFNFSTSLENGNEDKFQYTLAMRQRDRVIDGAQHNLVLQKRLGNLKVISNGYLMNNKNSFNRSSWEKIQVETFYDPYALVPGYRFDLDQNEIQSLGSDSIISTAMHFQSHQFYIRSSDSLKSQFRIEHIIRNDRQPFEGLMSDFTKTRTSNLKFNSEIGSKQRIGAIFTYRSLRFIGPFSNNEGEETIQGRFDWNANMADNHIRTDLTYTTANSRELRREFIFLPVNNGEGTHTWRDLNDDGIQDITEFFEAINLDERNYIKLFVPTDEFVSAFNNVLNWNVNARFPRSWRQKEGLLNILGRISNQTSINVNKKTTDDDLGSRFNPFDLSASDDHLIFTRTSLRNNLFYNRSSPKFGFDLGFNKSTSKQLITQGVETRFRSKYTLGWRLKLSKEFLVNWSLTQEIDQNDSDFLEDRNFEVRSRSTLPQLIWQPDKSFRMTNKFRYTNKSNLTISDVSESSTITGYEMEIRWSKATFNSLDFALAYSNIQFEGSENTPVAYVLLDALRPGNNFKWKLNYRQKLANGLQITIGYNGRKSKDQSVIHMGRMQVTALF